MAEIAHAFAEQTTLQTHTGDTSWTDISGAAIASGSFTTGKKYLLICKANLNGDNTAGNFGIKMLHGSTDFGTSENIIEVANTSQYQPYLWFTVWTAVASEGIKMQFATTTNTGVDTVRVDQITLFAMNLSDDLTEDTDWFFDETVADTTLSTTWSTTNNATKTFTPSGNSDWLVMTASRIDPDSAARNFESRINSSGDVTDTEPVCSQEGEDTANDRFVFTLLRAFALTNQSNTFTEQGRIDVATGGPRKSSTIFLLNLEKFKDHADVYTAAEFVFTSTSGYGDEVQTLGITPTQTGDVLILSHYIYDAQNISRTLTARQQVDNSDQPPTQTSDARMIAAPWDATDELIIADMTVESLDNTLHTIDNDAHVDATTDSPAAEDRTIVLIPMELAAVAAPDEIGARFLNIGHEGIQTFGPGVNR